MPLLRLVQRRSFEQLHGDLLAALLRAAELDVAAFCRLLNRVPEFATYKPTVIQQWLDGERDPESPIPLLIAMQEAAKPGELMPPEVAEVLKGA